MDRIKEGTGEIMMAEIEAIKSDVIDLYNASGKRVSGEFEKGLSTDYYTNGNVLKASIRGYTYLDGRKAGKIPPVQNILEWVKRKGIFPIEAESQATGLAWAIAKKIAKEGTNKEYHIKVYEQVITPARIDSIIKKVSEFNAQLFVNQVTTELKILTKNK